MKYFGNVCCSLFQLARLFTYRLLFCSSTVTRAWHTLRLLQCESGVACSVLWFVTKGNVCCLATMQQRKRVNLQEKLSIAIEPAQHIVLATLLFLSRKQRPIPLPRGGTQQMFGGKAPVPKSNPLPFCIPFSTKMVSL